MDEDHKHAECVGVKEAGHNILSYDYRQNEVMVKNKSSGCL